MKKVLSLCSMIITTMVLGSSAWADIQTLAPGEARGIRQADRLSLLRARTTSLTSKCKKIKSVNFLIKADTSNHIPGGDRRKGSYSVIGSRANCRPCSSGRCSILYKDGTQAGSVGYYGQWSRSHGGNGCARYYGGSGGAPAHSASRIISSARAKGRKLYLQSGTTCYEWNSDLRRIGNP